MHLVAGLSVADSHDQGRNSRALLTIPIRVNDTEVFFLVDTGANRSAIDSSLAQQLSLRHVGITSVRRNYSVQQMPAVMAEKLQVETKTFSSVVLIATDLGPLSQAQNTKISGILGTDILATSYVSFTYSSDRVRFLAQLRNPGIPVRLRRVLGGFLVPVTVGPQRLWLLLDSGTNMTAISLRSWQALPLAAKSDSLVDGLRSAETLVYSALGCAPMLQIGTTVLSNQPLRVVRPTKAGNFASRRFSGILGQDVLEHFQVTLDLAHAMLYLKPNLAYRVEPFKFETIGIQFFKDKSGAFIVAAVWRHSPAEESGITVGDRIVSIDAQRSIDLDIPTFSRHLHKAAGTPLTVVVEHAGDLSEFHIFTRRLACKTGD